MKKKSSMKRRLAAGALVAGLAAAGSLQAGASPITIQNQTFANFTSGYKPTDWTTTGNTVLINVTYGPGANYSAVGGTETDLNPADGQSLHLAANYSGGVNVLTASQNTTYQAQVGDTFTLTVAVADQIYDSSIQTAPLSAGNFAITINGVAVAENTSLDDPLYGTMVATHYTSGDPDFRKFVDGTATFTLTAADVLADPSLANGTVGVELLTPSDTAQYFYDNVRLDVESPVAAPEPSAWAMMLAGLVSLVGLRRFTRRA